MHAANKHPSRQKFGGQTLGFRAVEGDQHGVLARELRGTWDVRVRGPRVPEEPTSACLHRRLQFRSSSSAAPLRAEGHQP